MTALESSRLLSRLLHHRDHPDCIHGETVPVLGVKYCSCIEIMTEIKISLNLEIAV